MKITTLQNILNNAPIPRQEIILLLAFALGKSKEWIIAYPEKILTPNQNKKLLKLIKRRQNGEPLAYILGEKEFFSLPFLVNRHTLIPRPETEILVEKALETINSSPTKKLILDIGTGSGCIIISLAHNLEKSTNLYFLANDFSSSVLRIARKNSQRNQVKKNIDFFTDDLLGDKTAKKIITLIKKENFSEIVLTANLPYVAKKEYLNLEKTVKNFEPQTALLSGADGLDHYRKLLLQLKKFSAAHSQLKWTIFWEIGYQQKPLIKKGIRRVFPQSQMVFSKDLANRWRVVKFEIGCCNGKNFSTKFQGTKRTHGDPHQISRKNFDQNFQWL